MAGHSIESLSGVTGVAGPGSIGSDGATEWGVSLEGLVNQALQTTQSQNELSSMGKQVLEFGVSNPFLNGEITLKSPPEGGLISDASRESATMIGGSGITNGQFDDPRMSALVDTMKEMYMESAKTLLAWNIVHQISKDTKIMLQSQ